MNFRNETEIQCFLYSNLESMQKLIKDIIKTIYNVEVEEQEIEYVGVEYCIPTNCNAHWARGRKRIDILYEVRNIFIPIEIKTYASPDALSQVERYSQELEDFFGKKSLCGIIGERISKSAKQAIENEKHSFWVELGTRTYGVCK